MYFDAHLPSVQRPVRPHELVLDLNLSLQFAENFVAGMFLWTLTSVSLMHPCVCIVCHSRVLQPQRDGALENDIVTHEYTHGITNRMTGGGTGRCLQTTEAGGMGEGSFSPLYVAPDAHPGLLHRLVGCHGRVRFAFNSLSPVYLNIRFST
jgi:hypothetical protein